MNQTSANLAVGSNSNHNRIPIMKTTRILLPLLACCLAIQVAQANIVGYYVRPMQPGVNLIANQFLQGDNTLNTVLSGIQVPDGTAFTKWSGGSFLTPSVYDASSGAWSLNYTFALGEGGWLNAPTAFTNVFVGEVVPYMLPEFGSLPWTPGYGPGLHLISAPVPVEGGLNDAVLPTSMFNFIVGRAPVAGESVWTLDEATQTYSQATFDGSIWDNNLFISVGQAAWFDLGATGALPPPVPEPSALALAGIGATVLLGLRRRR
jgi:hypothetical protein